MALLQNNPIAKSSHADGGRDALIPTGRPRYPRFRGGAFGIVDARSTVRGLGYFAPFFARLSCSSTGSFSSGERTYGSSPVTDQKSFGGPIG
jgi:hypothetical protein